MSSGCVLLAGTTFGRKHRTQDACWSQSYGVFASKPSFFPSQNPSATLWLFIWGTFGRHQASFRVPRRLILSAFCLTWCFATFCLIVFCAMPSYHNFYNTFCFATPRSSENILLFNELEDPKTKWQRLLHIHDRNLWGKKG